MDEKWISCRNYSVNIYIHFFFSSIYLKQWLCGGVYSHECMFVLSNHLFIYCNCSFIHSFIYSFIHSLFFSFVLFHFSFHFCTINTCRIHSFILSFIHSSFIWLLNAFLAHLSRRLRGSL